ncbi:uncharacterized protein LOC132192379 [Neocloeon triangulifer]|uniref:uncharacterized protein LOC132192379 n=1 Tax=Neocloeon triangulifer TaxID=2078957 RepID=UPI00286F6F30|nr:uncharacterized protein LOC132192379 [Neocloeon triangulifer]
MQGQALFLTIVCASGIFFANGHNGPEANREFFIEKIKQEKDIYSQTKTVTYVCPARARKKFPAPDFGGEGNLSFDGCGIWTPDPTKEKNRPPWFIATKRKDDSHYCWGLLISARTAILYYCDESSNYFENPESVDEIQIFGGESCNDDEQGCHYNRLLLRDAKAVSVTPLRSHSSKEKFWLMVTSKIRLQNNVLVPICIYNRDNSDDLSTENFYYGSSTRIRNVKFPSPEDCCVNNNDDGFDEIIPYWREHFEEQICTNSWYQRVLINRKLLNGVTRHYLRGLLSFRMSAGHDQFGSFADVNAWLNEVISLAPDLSVIPQTPAPKLPTNFSSGLSFPDCGKVQIRQNIARRRTRTTDDLRPTGLVFGGVTDQKGATPWHASLSVHGKSGIVIDTCGGTLISKTAILTAAHCLFEEVSGRYEKLRPSLVEVTLGKYDSSKSNDLEPSRQSYFPKEVLVHSAYNHSANNFENDIALLIFDTNNFSFNDMVQPVCLWNKGSDIESVTSEFAEVAGWGLTAEGTRATILQKVDLNIVSHRTCFSQHKLFYRKYLKPTLNFCAGRLRQAATCVGDSGGGLMIYNHGRHYLRGITSSAPLKEKVVNGMRMKVCNSEYYSLFTDVTNYLDWIVKSVPDIN